MRWTKPKYGDIKIKRKFAIIPISIDRETRWLEWVTVKYVYCDRIRRRNDLTGEYYIFTGGVEEEFIDECKEV